MTASTTSTSLPCTCGVVTSRSGAYPSDRARRARFSATAAASSPTEAPRFRLAYGPTLTPPARVETPWAIRESRNDAKVWSGRVSRSATAGG